MAYQLSVMDQISGMGDIIQLVMLELVRKVSPVASPRSKKDISRNLTEWSKVCAAPCCGSIHNGFVTCHDGSRPAEQLSQGHHRTLGPGECLEGCIAANPRARGGPLGKPVCFPRGRSNSSSVVTEGRRAAP